MQAGASVGGFVLGEELGRSSLGSTWLAADAVGQRVVIKFLDRFGPAQPVQRDQLLDQFRLCRDALPTVRGRHCVAVEVVLDEAPVPALVTDLVAGPSLRGLLERGVTIAPEHVPALAGDLVDGLLAIHGAGLLHGALGPDTVLLATDGTVQLTDFGFPAALIGLTDHLPPEVLRGEPGGPYSDVHTLGALLRWILAGRQTRRQDELLHAMCAPDATARPTLPEVRDALAPTDGDTSHRPLAALIAAVLPSIGPTASATAGASVSGGGVAGFLGTGLMGTMTPTSAALAVGAPVAGAASAAGLGASAGTAAAAGVGGTAAAGAAAAGSTAGTAAAGTAAAGSTAGTAAAGTAAAGSTAGTAAAGTAAAGSTAGTAAVGSAASAGAGVGTGTAGTVAGSAGAAISGGKLAAVAGAVIVAGGVGAAVVIAQDDDPPPPPRPAVMTIHDIDLGTQQWQDAAHRLSVSLARGSGQATVAGRPVSFRLATPSGGPAATTYADLDGDGDDDALVALTTLDGNAAVVHWYAWQWDADAEKAVQVLDPIARTSDCGVEVTAITAVDGGVEIAEQWRNGSDCFGAPAGRTTRTVALDGGAPVLTAGFGGYGGACPQSFVGSDADTYPYQGDFVFRAAPSDDALEVVDPQVRLYTAITDTGGYPWLQREGWVVVRLGPVGGGADSHFAPYGDYRPCAWTRTTGSAANSG